MTREISISQFYQLLGLATASRGLEQQQNLMNNAWKEILPEDEGWFWDVINNTGDIAHDVKRALASMGVSIKE